jgi:alpha-glucosidase
MPLTHSIPWWTRTTIYQVYLRSFFDASGDGIGDLRGALQKIDYLHDLGVETLWLSPFYQSPHVDAGYDISDYASICPDQGTLDDLRQLVDAAHARGMRVLADMVMNHTSDQHAWFRASRSSKTDEKRDWYIWRPGRKPQGQEPPNNWRSILGPRGWQWDETSGEWYWASFLPCQPDLNYRHPDVQKAMLDVVRKWLAFGFDGFRLDIFHALFKDETFADNPFSPRLLPSEEDPDGFFQSFRATLHHPDTIRFARTLRRVVDEFQDPPRFLIGEVFGQPHLLRKYCEGDDGLHTVFLFKAMQTPFTARDFRTLIQEFEREMPAPLLPTWVFGNHDRMRKGERLDHDQRREKLCAALQLSARGIPCVYNGEEIGMQDLHLPLDGALDPVAGIYRFIPEFMVRLLHRQGILLNRDACRTPMQWSSTPNAGFTDANATPWLPIHPNFKTTNVEKQTRDPDSILNCYRKFLLLRKEHPALHSGSLSLWPENALPPSVLGIRREHEDETIDVLLHFDEAPRTIVLDAKPARVLASTYASCEDVRDKRVTLRPYEALVLGR